MNWKYLFIVIIIIIFGFSIWMIVSQEINIEDVPIEISNPEVGGIYPDSEEIFKCGQSVWIEIGNRNERKILIELYRGDEKIDDIDTSNWSNRILWNIDCSEEVYQGDKFKLKILDSETYEVLDESDYYFSIIGGFMSEDIIAEELGMKFTLSDDFIEVFGNPYFSDIGIKSFFSKFDNDYNSGLIFRGHVDGFQYFSTPLGLNRDSMTYEDILETCSNDNEFEDERECRIIEIDGEKAVFQTILYGREGVHYLHVEVYLSNPSDSKYKGLIFILDLSDVRTSSDDSIVEFHTQSQNIMENKNLSKRDEERLRLFNKMIRSIKFIR
jgi:hypothetical protein